MAFPAAGFDRNDGGSTSGGVGTATVALSVQQRPSATWFEEDPNSPEIERGEQITSRHSYSCDPTTGQTLALGLPRGALRQDTSGNYWRVLTSTLQREHGDKCKLILVEEGIGTDTPPDECSFDVVEFNPPLEEHPRYSRDTFGIGTTLVRYNLNALGDKIVADELTGPQIVQAAKQAANSASINNSNENLLSLNVNNVTDPIILGLAEELAQKFYKYINTFYFAGIRVTWSTYYWFPQPPNPGGIVEDPVAKGGLPPFFWSSDGSATGTNVLESMVHTLNPTLFPVADSTTGKYLSWLRYADQTTFIRSLVKVTRTWIGGPGGKWDTDLYYVNA